jgi:hypothetical protein
MALGQSHIAHKKVVLPQNRCVIECKGAVPAAIKTACMRDGASQRRCGHRASAEVTRLSGGKSSVVGQKLKWMRWLLLRAGRRMRGKARIRFNALIAGKEAAAPAWMVKESFDDYWSS